MVSHSSPPRYFCRKRAKMEAIGLPRLSSARSRVPSHSLCHSSGRTKGHWSVLTMWWHPGLMLVLMVGVSRVGITMAEAVVHRIIFSRSRLRPGSAPGDNSAGSPGVIFRLSIGTTKLGFPDVGFFCTLASTKTHRCLL